MMNALRSLLPNGLLIAAFGAVAVGTTAPVVRAESGAESVKVEVQRVAGLNKQMRGIASWYGPGFSGRPTASGETFNPNAMTAAHRSLPFGTKVRVTNAHTGQSVVVRINDRGPFVRGRVIDLSAAAARAIGLVGSGVAPVRIDVVGR